MQFFRLLIDKFQSYCQDSLGFNRLVESPFKAEKNDVLHFKIVQRNPNKNIL